MATYCNYDSTGVVLYVGGNYNQNLNHGAFYLDGNYVASNTNSNISCRTLVNLSNFRRGLRRGVETAAGINQVCRGPAQPDRAAETLQQR